jgi:uncharacterized protein YegL
MPNLEQNPFAMAQFAENSEPRCPCLLLLDTSGSMNGQPIAELNKGLVTFERDLKGDGLAAKRVEVAIVSFGPVQMVQDFTGAADFQAPHLNASGNTPMGEAIEKGIDMLKKRKDTYRQNGIAYYRPWIFLITDGAPTDDIQNAAHLVHQGEGAKQFTFYAVMVDNAPLDSLRTIAVRTPLRLRGLSFAELFRWLSSSLQSTSRSNPGDAVALLNPAAPNGWATTE